MGDDKKSLGNEVPEIAYYYPNTMWYSGDWIKSLLLFFDGVALLVPRNDAFQTDAPLADDLRERGLLHILRPEAVVDKLVTERLAERMVDILTSGALNRLGSNDTELFEELSYSRLGYQGDPGLAAMIFEELKVRGLARDRIDGMVLSVHRMVRALILVLLAQILRSHGREMGAELSPATDRSDLVTALSELLSMPGMPSTGHVVASDFRIVGVDLGRAPIDEVLSFRKEYLGQHRAYVRSVRRFVRDLSVLPTGEAATTMQERDEELDELANDLRKMARRAWRQPASFGLSAAGAAWTLVTGDPVGAVLAAGAATAGLSTGSAPEVGAYSYLFTAKRRFP